MTSRRPLVNVSGTIKELPTGDDIGGLIPGPFVYLTRNGVNRTIPGAGAQTDAQFTTRVSDTGNLYDTSTFKLTPTVAGKYIVIYSALMLSMADGTRFYPIVNKNAVNVSSGTAIKAGAAGNQIGLSVIIADMNGTTDYLSFAIGQEDSVSRDLYGGIEATNVTVMFMGGPQGPIGPTGVAGNAISGVDLRTGTAENAALSNVSGVIEMNNASANTLTILNEATIAWPANASFNGTQVGAGATVITAGPGVTIRSNGNRATTNGQWAVWSVYKRGTNDWVLAGDLKL